MLAKSEVRWSGGRGLEGSGGRAGSVERGIIYHVTPARGAWSTGGSLTNGGCCTVYVCGLLVQSRAEQRVVQGAEQGRRARVVGICSVGLQSGVVAAAMARVNWELGDNWGLEAARLRDWGAVGGPRSSRTEAEEADAEADWAQAARQTGKTGRTVAASAGSWGCGLSESATTGGAGRKVLVSASESMMMIILLLRNCPLSAYIAGGVFGDS